MSISTVTAARIYKGQKAGQTGEEAQLEFDKFPFAGFSRVNIHEKSLDELVEYILSLFCLDLLHKFSSGRFGMLCNRFLGRNQIKEIHSRTG